MPGACGFWPACHTWLVLALFATASCAGDGAGATADRFMDLYFVEADQQRALPLTAGPAQAKLKRELDSVREIRKSGYGPRQARGNVYYERVSSGVLAKDKAARFIYNVSLGGHATGDRHVVVTVRRAGGWRVVNFLVRDGAAQRRAKKPDQKPE